MMVATYRKPGWLAEAGTLCKFIFSPYRVQPVRRDRVHFFMSDTTCCKQKKKWHHLSWLKKQTPNSITKQLNVLFAEQ